MPVIAADTLRRFAERTLLSAGVPPHKAASLSAGFLRRYP